MWMLRWYRGLSAADKAEKKNDMIRGTGRR
jgi:hypothetical protein